MWRNTGQPVRIFMLDARACLPILCAAVYWSLPTLYIAIIGFAFFAAISFAGLTLPALWRMVRRWLVGRTRTAVPVWKREAPRMKPVNVEFVSAAMRVFLAGC